MGLINLPTISDYWKTTWESHVPFFSKVMPRNRFQIILSHLHVSHTEPGCTEKKTDKIQMFLDQLLPKFRENYNPSENISVDETMIGHRGRFSVIQYMPQKPTKWGIKLYSLADSLNGYILDILVYTGSETQTNPVYSHLPKTSQTVMHLVTPYLDSGYHVYTDRFYSSTTLSETLESRSTHFTGTVNNNRKDLPDVIRSTPGKKFSLPAGGYKAFRRGRSMIAAWRPEKKKKNIFMLSTGYTSKLTTIPSRRSRVAPIQKPEVVHQYNQSMNGVDISDQLSVYYSFSRKSIKWWRKIFFHGLEVAIINSHILYKTASPNSTLLTYRRLILDNLASSFIANTPTTSRGRPRLIPSSTPERLDSQKHFLGKRSSEKHDCKICSHNSKRKRTVYYCNTCQTHPPLCPVGCFEIYHTKAQL